MNDENINKVCENSGEKLNMRTSIMAAKRIWRQSKASSGKNSVWVGTEKDEVKSMR